MFDMVFLGDFVGMKHSDVPKGVFGRTSFGDDLEPITLIAALSQDTTHIGLAATASTTLQTPYQMARQFASVDHLSGGRVAWNVVTSSRDEEARNFNAETMLDKALRYERAHEFVDIAFGLWESWEEDAFVRDKRSGVFFDPRKMHPIKHEGKFFKVHGPLNMPRTPQGRPIIIQAGSSPAGMGLASRIADVVYTVQTSLEEGRAFYAGVKKLVREGGRDPDTVKIMPGILSVIGPTQAAAEERYRIWQNEIDPLVGLENLAPFFGDLSGHDLDGPAPELRTDRPVISRGETQLRLARRNNWSIRQLYQSTAIGNTHHVVVGSPERIADVMEEWFVNQAADGFNVLPAKAPQSIHEFVDQVVPVLQRRGLLRTAYESTTLRGNLGLPPLPSRYAAPTA
jgi:alkanesulfonate monooxygenase